MTFSSDSRAENQRTRTIPDDVIRAVASILVIGNQRDAAITELRRRAVNSTHLSARECSA